MMRHDLWKTIGAVVISATALLPILQAEEAKEPVEDTKKMLSFSKEATHNISLNKINKIKEMLEIYVQRQEDLNSKHVIIRLEREIAREIPPLVPYKRLIQIEEKELEAEAKQEIEELYEDKEYFARITRAATREAAKRYPLYKLGSKVKIQYKQGHHNYVVEGVLYENNVRFIQIGDRQINVNFLDPETKLRFNAVANEDARQDYIQRQQRRLSSKQLNDTEELYDKKLMEMDNQNEKNGYIFDTSTQSWTTAKQYLAGLLGPARQRQLEAKKALEEKEKQRILANQKAGTYTDEEFNAVREKLIAAQKKVSEANSGIDADPGYEGIGWTASYSDLRVIFSRAQGIARNTFITPKTDEEKKIIDMDGEILKYAEGKPSTIYFFFVTDNEQVARLNRVEFVYGDLTPDEIDEVLTAFVERYGKTKEAGSGSDKELLEKVIQNKSTNEQQFSWIGKTTEASLRFTYNGELDMFKDVRFVKKNIAK